MIDVTTTEDRDVWDALAADGALEFMAAWKNTTQLDLVRWVVYGTWGCYWSHGGRDYCGANRERYKAIKECLEAGLAGALEEGA